MRPWFRTYQDECLTWLWDAEWGYWGDGLSGWHYLGSVSFEGVEIQRIWSGVASTSEQTVFGTHRHNDNSYSTSGFGGIQPWCYDYVYVQHTPGGATISACGIGIRGHGCTGGPNCTGWTISVP